MIIRSPVHRRQMPLNPTLPSRRPSSTHRGAGRASLGKVEHPTLNDLAQGGPVCSALPGRRLAGWLPHPRDQRPRRRCQATEQAADNNAPDTRHILAGRGFVMSRAVRRAGTDDAAAQQRRRRRPKAGPGPAARAAPSGAALNPYRNSSQTWRALESGHRHGHRAWAWCPPSTDARQSSAN
jgi:hypothetical protein